MAGKAAGDGVRDGRQIAVGEDLERSDTVVDGAVSLLAEGLLDADGKSGRDLALRSDGPVT